MSQPPQPSASTAHSPLDALQPACEHLRAGGLVILPTDTVYGIGCNAADAGAVERLLASKGRGRQMPPPVLVAGPADLTGVVAQVPEAARILMEAFWPGPLTLILDADAALTWDLGETSGTIAIRMPDHELALDLLRRSGPLAVTSPRILRKGVLSPADLERVAGVNIAEQTAQATHNKPEVGA